MARCSAENRRSSAGVAQLTAPSLTAEGESCLVLAAGSTEEGYLASAAGSAEEGRSSTPSSMEKGCPPAQDAAESRQSTRDATLLD